LNGQVTSESVEVSRKNSASSSMAILLRHHEEAVLVDVALHADVALACDLDAHAWARRR